MLHYRLNYRIGTYVMFKRPTKHVRVYNIFTDFFCLMKALSTKLGKIASLFSHVTLIDIDFNRKCFTKHGLHLNNAGK